MPEPNPLLHARYGVHANTLPPLDLNPVVEHLLSHRTMRHFLSRPLPSNTLETLVAAAQSAPSSSNLQLWGVVAVQSQEKRDRLAALAGNQAHIRQAPLILAWLADVSRLKRIAGYKNRAVDALSYLDTTLTATIDAALAAQNVVTAAEALGLGTVYIGALRNRPEEVAQVLGNPAGVFTVFGLVIGHPDPAQPAAIKPRLPQFSVLHHERYQAPEDLPAEIGRYDEVLGAFQTRQGQPVVGLTGPALERVAQAGSLNGRERLSDALKSAGFELR
ncbi:MAG: nitroreductase family protein [Burkholderiaceae bacterium]|nr:MAG: nitroreductase family protein [Burkholderiaceae bacterium]